MEQIGCIVWQHVEDPYGGECRHKARQQTRKCVGVNVREALTDGIGKLKQTKVLEKNIKGKVWLREVCAREGTIQLNGQWNGQLNERPGERDQRTAMRDRST